MSLSTLAQTQAAAQAQALAFQVIGSPAHSRPARRTGWIAAALIAALLAGGAAAITLQHPPAQAAAPEAPTPSRHPARLWETSEDEPAAHESASARKVAEPAAAASAPRGALAMSISHGSVRIEARAASRWDAARQLAELTGTQLLGQPEALAHARPLALRWEGRDLRAAWIVLLGDEVSHGLQCAAPGACRIWVLGSPAGAEPGSASAPLRHEPPTGS